MKHTTDWRSNASLANETKLDENFSIPGSSTRKLPLLYLFTRVHDVHAKPRGIYSGRTEWPPQANLGLKGSMAAKTYSQPSMGVLLPICLLAVFLSCVVCAYRWQSERERKMDMEDKRKKKKKKIDSRNVSESGYVLGTYKPFNESIRGYLWNTSKLQELSIISNNNTKFEIPTTPTYYSWPSQFFENIRRPSAVDLPMMLQGCRGGISKSTGSYQSFDGMTDESGCCYSSEASSSLNLPSSSANTTKSFNEDGGGTFSRDCFVIGDDVYRLTNSRNGDSFAAVETLNGSLTEHWV